MAPMQRLGITNTQCRIESLSGSRDTHSDANEATLRPLIFQRRLLLLAKQKPFKCSDRFGSVQLNFLCNLNFCEQWTGHTFGGSGATSTVSTNRDCNKTTKSYRERAASLSASAWRMLISISSVSHSSCNVFLSSSSALYSV